MNRNALGFLIVLATLIAPLAIADTLRCESEYGRRHECTFGGWGRVALSHQLSKTACVEGRTWGRSGRHGVWVSDGCRADFLISRDRDSGNNGYGNNGYGDNGHRNRAEVITCESNGRFTRCSANTRFGVQMNRQLSGASCVEGRSWGYDDGGIWVDRGCRAEFVVGDTNRAYRRDNSAYDRLVVCESINNTRHFCSADTRLGVQLSRQLSTNACVFNQTWGYNNREIWVSHGCRAEFLIGR